MGCEGSGAQCPCVYIYTTTHIHRYHRNSTYMYHIARGNKNKHLHTQKGHNHSHQLQLSSECFQVLCVPGNFRRALKTLLSCMLWKRCMKQCPGTRISRSWDVRALGLCIQLHLDTHIIISLICLHIYIYIHIHIYACVYT